MGTSQILNEYGVSQQQYLPRTDDGRLVYQLLEASEPRSTKNVCFSHTTWRVLANSFITYI